jgi:hypothetical protein
MTRFRAELAPRIAPVVLANLTRRSPYHDSRLFVEGDGPYDPMRAHSAFGNSYDWHSSVHSHWTALELIAFAGDAAAGHANLRAAIARNLSADNVRAETAYLAGQPAYERPYGWAWALRLAERASRQPEVLGEPARDALRDLADLLATRAAAWLELMPGPVRHGVHSNSAFAMGLMLDAARSLGFARLEQAVRRRARGWFAGDRDYPAQWERSAHDFLSQGLTEADLMRRIMDGGEFAAWWRAFVPSAASREALYSPALVALDADDGQIVHLHGLNLSRAGQLARISGALGAADDPLRGVAVNLFDSSVEHAVSGTYASTHWLPTFAWDAACSLDARAAAI